MCACLCMCVCVCGQRGKKGGSGGRRCGRLQTTGSQRRASFQLGVFLHFVVVSPFLLLLSLQLPLHRAVRLRCLLLLVFLPVLPFAQRNIKLRKDFSCCLFFNNSQQQWECRESRESGESWENCCQLRVASLAAVCICACVCVCAVEGEGGTVKLIKL